MRVSTVPISPVTRPAALSPASTRYTVDVLPAVPVMPMMLSSAVGRPYTREATVPRACLGSSTSSTGRPVASARAAPAGSVRIATAPASAAGAANSAPCTRLPGSAA